MKIQIALEVNEHGEIDAEALGAELERAVLLSRLGERTDSANDLPKRKRAPRCAQCRKAIK